MLKTYKKPNVFLLENLGFPALAVANRSMSVPIELECQYCSLLGLRLSVLGQDRSGTIKSVLVLVLHAVVLVLYIAVLVLQVWCCVVKERRSCHARRHNDLERHSNFSSTISSVSILYLEHHYCGYQQWCSLS